MALHGQAFLALWNDIAKSRETEYDQWHTLEHVPERVAVTGVHGARRYVNRTRDSHRYFTLYDVANLAVFESPEYIDLLQNPTPASASMRPDFSNFVRATCAVRQSTGIGIGGAIACLCVESSAVAPNAIDAALARTLALPGVTSVHWGGGPGGLPAIPWKNAPATTVVARVFDAVILVEALGRGAAAAALVNLRTALSLPDFSADFGAEVYDLTFVFPGADPDEPLLHRRPGWDKR